jgi:ATP-dependent DNA ligase
VHRKAASDAIGIAQQPLSRDYGDILDFRPHWSDHVRALRWRRDCVVGHSRRMGRSPQTRADTNAEPPAWIKPQLCQLVKEAPSGENWAHELKFDGYRIHARIDRADIRLLTRTGLDWTEKYPTIAAAMRTLWVRKAYLDGELCGCVPTVSRPLL